MKEQASGRAVDGLASRPANEGEDLAMRAEYGLALIRGSFDKLWPVSGQFTTLFYDHLFDRAPQTRLSLPRRSH
jgi:hypothetical protein